MTDKEIRDLVEHVGLVLAHARIILKLVADVDGCFHRIFLASWLCPQLTYGLELVSSMLSHGTVLQRRVAHEATWKKRDRWLERDGIADLKWSVKVRVASSAPRG